MPYFIWSSELETGISCIDRQHQRIIDDINDLHEVGRKTGQCDVLADVVKEMHDYMVKHFTFEEELLNEAGYEFLKAHERLHFLFLKHMDDYRQRLQAGENIVPELLAMLKTWWEHHIANEDADFVAAVTGKFSGGDPLAAEWLSATLKMHFAGREA